MMERDMQSPEKISTHHVPRSSLALTFFSYLLRNILSHYLQFIALYWSITPLCTTITSGFRGDQIVQMGEVTPVDIKS